MKKHNIRDFFNNDEMIFYKNLNDLSEKIIKISRMINLEEKLLKRKNKIYEIF